jgi:DNA-binding NarL/FixJ family response regulator
LKRIVLADDSRVVRHALRKMFEESGLDRLRRSGKRRRSNRKGGALKPDVGILDLSMPKAGPSGAKFSFASGGPFSVRQ